MERTIEALKILVALIAAFIIATVSMIIDEQEKDPLIKFTYINAILLLISFVYLHYMLHKYLYPISLFTETQKQQIQEATGTYYKQSFFRGIIGAGYLCLLISIQSSIMSHSFNYIFAAILLVIIGIISKSRGLILFLLNETNIESDKNS